MMRSPVRPPKIIAAALVALGACHPTEPLEPLVVEGAASVLFVGQRADDTAFVFALPVDDGRAALPALASRPGDLWWAIAYACPLDRLGLPSGSVALEATVAFEESPLPGWAALVNMEPSGGGVWRDAEPTPFIRDVLRRLPLAEDFRCASVRPEITTDASEFRLPDRGSLYLPTFAVARTNTRLFVTTIQSVDFSFTATTGHAAFEFDLSDGSVVEHDLGEDPVLAGYQDDRGELWLVTPKRVLRGTVGGEFVVVASLEAFAPIRRVVVSGSGVGDGVVLSIGTTGYDGGSLNTARRWLRYEGGAIEQLASSDRFVVVPQSVSLGGRDLLAINVDIEPPAIHTAIGDRVDARPTSKRYVELYRDAELGVLARDQDRALFRFDGSDFEPFLDHMPFVTARLASDAGLVFAGNGINETRGHSGGSAVRVAQYFESTGTCEYEPEQAGVGVYVVPLLDPRQAVALQLSATSGQLRATRITLGASAPACLRE